MIGKMCILGAPAGEEVSHSPQFQTHQLTRFSYIQRCVSVRQSDLSHLSLSSSLGKRRSSTSLAGTAFPRYSDTRQDEYHRKLVLPPVAEILNNKDVKHTHAYQAQANYTQEAYRIIDSTVQIDQYPKSQRIFPIGCRVELQFYTRQHQSQQPRHPMQASRNGRQPDVIHHAQGRPNNGPREELQSSPSTRFYTCSSSRCSSPDQNEAAAPATQSVTGWSFTNSVKNNTEQAVVSACMRSSSASHTPSVPIRSVSYYTNDTNWMPCEGATNSSASSTAYSVCTNDELRTRPIPLSSSREHWDMRASNPALPLSLAGHHHYSRRPASADFEQAAARYICSLCYKRFLRPSSLQAHYRVHTGERPFKCLFAGCTRAFTVQSNRTRHQRTCHKDNIR